MAYDAGADRRVVALAADIADLHERHLRQQASDLIEGFMPGAHDCIESARTDDVVERHPMLFGHQMDDIARRQRLRVDFDWWLRRCQQRLDCEPRQDEPDLDKSPSFGARSLAIATLSGFFG